MQDDSRSVLKEALKQALAGGNDAESIPLLPEPAELSQLEKSAWLQLRNWSEDLPLRKQFPEHAEFSKRRLTEILTSL